MSNKPELNDQQKVAVDTKLRLPAIVTAAAGSGKTFVLVERVIRLICDRSLDIPIDSLAIMTFTRNATRSMRQKLNKALDDKLHEINEKILELKQAADASDENEILELEKDHEYIKEQKFKLRQTTISTIDAFCLKMIKENIELFDLPVNFTLADSARTAAFQIRAINLAMQDFYDESSNLFTEEERNTLFYTFSFDDDALLQKAIINFENELSTYVNADEWLEKAQEVYKDEDSLKAQYLGEYESFFDAYFRRSTNPSQPEGLIQKYLNNYDRILTAVLNEGNTLRQELTQEIADLTASHARQSSIDAATNKLNTANTLVNQVIPAIQASVANEKSYYKLAYDAYDIFKSNKTISSLSAVFDAIKNVPDPPTLSVKGSKTPSRPLIKENKDVGVRILERLNSHSFNNNDLANQQTAVRAFIKLEKAYMKHYQQLKSDNGCVNFSDCELMLLNKLKDPKNEEFRKSLQERFKYIIVDEFQDSNDIQAELFKIIASDTLFYVGDIKQSIYAFRGGNPKIMARLVDGGDGFTPVPLSTNYRSRKTVLDVVNNAFTGLMTKEYGDVDYSNQDNRLEFGARYLYDCDAEDETADEATDTSNNTFVPVDSDEYCAEIHFISGKPTEENKDMRQPRFVAKRIQQLHDDPNFLITKGGKRVRPNYSDFLVLIRKKGQILQYRKALSELNIHSTSPKGQKFLLSEEIELMLNLLAVIDNPLKDEEMLKVLMSPIYRFTAEEVTDIRLGLLGLDKSVLTDDQKKELAKKHRNSSLYKCLKTCSENLKLNVKSDDGKSSTAEIARNVPQKLAQFMSDLKNFRYYMSSNSLHKLVCRIYEDTDAELIAAAFADSAQRVANVRQFQNIAADFEERNGGSLGDFLRFIDRVKSNEDQKVEDATRPEDSLDAVQIMSFHVSKGLEAPICILCELDEQISKNDYTGTLLNNRQNYFSMLNVDYKNRIKSNSFAYSALKLINRKRLCGEELRLLYVALTRAQEKLIMVTEKDIKEFYSYKFDKDSPEETFSSNVSFNWILQSLSRYHRTNNKFDDFNCVLFDEKYDGAAPEKPKDDTQEYNVPAEIAQALHNKINFEYAHIDDTKRQEKFSVTELAHRNSDMPITLATPDFIEKELSGADRGNAYHNCMQYISFERFKNLENDDPVDIVKDEIEHLASNKKLNEREVKCIDPKVIADFFTSEFGQRVLRADRIKCEEPFFVEVQGSEIGENDLADIMLQGRVDMYFVENGEIVVVDYKTDSKTNLEKEKENYAKQVKIYSTVLKKLKGMNVKEVYLYSFTDGKAISIK